MPETWTVGRLQQWATGYLQEKGVSSPRLSADLLLARVLGKSRVEVYLNFERPMAPAELAAFKQLILRRRAGEPMAYILGEKEFFGLPLKVGPGVLVPRPETELLVELALEKLAANPAPKVLDLCTGSGAVALALAHELPRARLVGVDISGGALAYAAQNSRALGLEDRVEWLAGHLFSPLAASGAFFDMILANPPYVSLAEYGGLSGEVKDFEPREALLAGERGLDVIAEILGVAGSFLRPFAWLALEIGRAQGEAARSLAREAGIFPLVEIKKDLAGLDRVLICQRGDYG